jgi:ketose-bisphosphate aldolase
MPIVPVPEMLAHAARKRYAVGYFECWNYESLRAVADAANAARSPVLIGFSGIYLPHPGKHVSDRLSTFAAMGLDICRGLSVPANLVFNESPYEEWIRAAIDLRFGMVMFTDENLSKEEQLSRVKIVVELAHQAGVSVEGEIVALPGLGGELLENPKDLRMTEPEEARDFVECTGVDTFAVNVGQAHWHGRRQVALDLERLARLSRSIRVPLVLHGASSIRPEDLTRSIELGVRKVNVGSRLKQAFFDALRTACLSVNDGYNPYEIVGSGLRGDVLLAGRTALQAAVEQWMVLLRSAGNSW